MLPDAKKKKSHVPPSLPISLIFEVLVVLIKRAQDNDLITGLATNFLHD
jgi:hypothetical protein